MSIIVEKPFHFDKGRRGRKTMLPGAAPYPMASPSSSPAPGRTPRVARMMALALTLEGMLRDGEVRDYAEMARQSNVSGAYVTQIMSLLNLAPDIQEHILFLQKVDTGRDSLTIPMLMKISVLPSWPAQRAAWGTLCQHIDATTIDT